MLPTLRPRPWGWAAPALFVMAGILAMLDAPLRLDYAVSVNYVCAAKQAAGTLSWRHYGHQWASLGLVATLALTPLALARAEWPSRLASLTLAGRSRGVAVGAVVHRHDDHSAHAGLGQRIGLLVVHGWVLLCAVTLLIEASPGWPPADTWSRRSDV